jgi:hypothetical protein
MTVVLQAKILIPSRPEPLIRDLRLSKFSHRTMLPFGTFRNISLQQLSLPNFTDLRRSVWMEFLTLNFTFTLTELATINFATGCYHSYILHWGGIKLKRGGTRTSCEQHVPSYAACRLPWKQKLVVLSEKLVTTYKITRRHKPEERNAKFTESHIYTERLYECLFPLSVPWR